MATQAEFNADPWVRREIVTAELNWLGDELCRRTGRPRGAAGTKGDYQHLRGAHRSQEFVEKSPLCTSRTYTKQTGLTADQPRHIAGFDFTPGATEAMIAQSGRLLGAMKAGQLEEVREIYCNVDGDKVVDGWDNVRNVAATSDSSHLWHWHLSLDRRHCANRPLMERILAIALGDTANKEEEEDTDMMTPAQDGALSVTWQASDALLDMQETTDGGTREMKFVREFNQLRRDVTTLLKLQAAEAAKPTPIDYEKLADALLRRVASTPRVS
ncbi:hypothetical protein OG792_07930 [Micromonospora sp. NBC_01699]|uniref:hypothetical protein n=1 Tax=Micromonospora sp. NBC_01699 TaxID=2975984 RepID=UPI002E36E39A|nr:hypothetical protein [Micromonospora sp. NBC_01699]